MIEKMRFLKENLPYFDELTKEQVARLEKFSRVEKFGKGEKVYNSSSDCLGLLVINYGQVRVYTVSASGKELTLFRLLDGDICLFTAACALKAEIEMSVMCKTEVEAVVIPPNIVHDFSEENIHVSNYINDVLASRFSDVMWLIEQTLFKSFDERLATFLLDEMSIEGANKITLTHDEIANHLGSAREVVTRMLKHFQNEGFVALTRGAIELLDIKGLQSLIKK